MDAISGVLSRFQYTGKSWQYAKALTIFTWLAFILLGLRGPHTVPCTAALTKYFNVLALLSAPYNYVIALVAIILTILYLREKLMALTLLLLLVISILVFSVAVSDGNRPRFEIISLVLLAQLIAYLQYPLMGKNFKAAAPVRNLAMLYSIQVIAACYMLSAISKLQLSGIDWMMNAPNAALRVIVSFTSRSLDINQPVLAHTGQKIAVLILGHPFLIRAAFAVTFLIEFLAVVATWGRKQARYYGWLLLIMHLFILLIMGIVIIPFVLLVIACLVNLPDKNSVAIPAPTPKNYAFHIKAILFQMGIPAFVIALCLAIGEIHPFSKFPMFSSMSNTANYYWLQNQDGKALSPLKCFGLRTDELKNRVNDAAVLNGTALQNNAQISAICQPLLQGFVAGNVPALQKQQVSEIKLLDHRLWLENGTIYQRDTVLADVILEKPANKN